MIAGSDWGEKREKMKQCEVVVGGMRERLHTDDRRLPRTKGTERGCSAMM